MRKIYPIFIPLLIGVVPYLTAAQAGQAFKTAIVGFYNVENLYDTIFHGKKDDAAFTPNGTKAYTTQVYQDKLQKLANVISQLGKEISQDGAVLLGVAEIENALVLDDLLKEPSIAQQHYQYVHYDSRDARGLDVALIYHPKYFRVIRSRPLIVKLPPGTKSSVYTRDILWVLGSLNGERVHVFVNHWPSRYGGEKRSEPARMAAAKTLRYWVDSLMLQDGFAKIIIMGDFNDNPDQPSIRFGLKATDQETSLAPDGLFNPWLKLYKRGLGTLAYQDAWSLFDQIFISSAFLTRHQSGFFYYQHRIFAKNFMIENRGAYKGYPMRSYAGDLYRGGYSDHFPIYLVLIKR